MQAAPSSKQLEEHAQQQWEVRPATSASSAQHADSIALMFITCSLHIGVCQIGPQYEPCLLLNWGCYAGFIAGVACLPVWQL